MHTTIIDSELEYQKALKRLEIIFDAPIGTTKSDEADAQGEIVDDYEKEHYPIHSLLS